MLNSELARTIPYMNMSQRNIHVTLKYLPSILMFIVDIPDPNIFRNRLSPPITAILLLRYTKWTFSESYQAPLFMNHSNLSVLMPDLMIMKWDMKTFISIMDELQNSSFMILICGHVLGWMGSLFKTMLKNETVCRWHKNIIRSVMVSQAEYVFSFGVGAVATNRLITYNYQMKWTRCGSANIKFILVLVSGKVER